MSGSLSSFGLGAVAGSTLSELGGVAGIAGSALGSILTTAAFRGVTFFMINAEETAGRRLVRWLFPASTLQKFQDFGEMQGPITVTGLIIGDDYVLRAERMRAALLKSGPAVLVHPWYGRLRVRLAEPARLSFSDREIRMAHFSATFFRDPETGSAKGLFQSIEDTFSNALTQADALVDQGVLAAQSALSVVAIPAALAGAVSSLISQTSGIWGSLVSASAEPIQTATASAQAAMTAGVTPPVSNVDTTYANTIVTILAGVPSAIANAVATTDQSVVAPATLVADGASESVDPQAAVTILLSGALQTGNAALALSNTVSVPSEILTLGVVARLLCVTQAVAASGSVSYVSQPDALAGRDALIAAIDALGTDIEDAASGGATVSLSGMWAALRDLRAAVIADYSDRIGRLPAVLSLTIHRPLSAWTIAYAIAGDTPGNVVAVMEDLVARNDLVHPALAGPGTIAVLDLSS